MYCLQSLTLSLFPNISLLSLYSGTSEERESERFVMVVMALGVRWGDGGIG